MADTKRKDRIAELYQALKKKNKYLAQICGDQPLEDPLQAISNIYDNTFLHLAIRFKQKDMVEELLTMLPEEGNPPLWNIKNKEGNTILHELACSDSMMNLAGKVLGRYEPYEDKRKELEMLLTARNEFGETPIFCAARHGQTEMFKFLAKEMKLKVGSVKDVMSLPEDMKLKELQELSKSQHHLQRDDKTTVLHISITTECFACNPTAFGKNMKMRQGVMEELMISLDPFKELGNNLKKIFNMCTSKDNIGNGDTRMTSYKRCSPILQKLVELLDVKKACKMHLTKPLNNDHQTAEELFAASKENLHQNAKEWLMRTAFAGTTEGISEALSVLATSAPACSSNPLCEPSFILPSNMSSASTHPMKSPTSKFQLLMARMDMFQNGMNHIMQKVKNTSEDQQLLLKLVDDIAMEVATLDYYIFSRED
eukprot:XP_019074202.1 PREDICTED: uncharacterized protein LOC104878537 [Vitis vinifera]